ncbi:MAG: toll/interleukin-1 receptor domain-containing protein [bacterium]
MAQIFISYRRQDTAYLAATLSDKLQQHFGENSVFFDVDNIPLGVDFREYIGNAAGQCDVLLAIIGDKWMGIDSSRRRVAMNSWILNWK